MRVKFLCSHEVLFVSMAKPVGVSVSAAMVAKEEQAAKMDDSAGEGRKGSKTK